MAESSANPLLTQFHCATSLIQDSLVGRRRSAQSIDAFKSSIVEFDIDRGAGIRIRKRLPAGRANRAVRVPL